MALIAFLVGIIIGSIFAAFCYGGYIGSGTMTLDDRGSDGVAYNIRFDKPEKLLERKSVIIKIRRGKLNIRPDDERKE